MTISFRPATRENTPLIIGIAGPTKSGKTMSALRLATGLANGGPIAMINTEGPRGHAYADTYRYVACELSAPFRPAQYIEALKASMGVTPAVVIVDSVSHMHDGPGGILEWHEELLDRMAGQDQKRRERATFAAWVQPKAAENAFIYELLAMAVPVILCLRAKEKIRIKKGEVQELGWQPIVGERIAFESFITLMLPPHAKGVPDLTISELRTPFDTMIPSDRPIDESLGQTLAAWSRGEPAQIRASGSPLEDWLALFQAATTLPALQEAWKRLAAPAVWGSFSKVEQDSLTAAKEAAKARLSPAA